MRNSGFKHIKIWTYMISKLKKVSKFQIEFTNFINILVITFFGVKLILFVYYCYLYSFSEAAFYLVRLTTITSNSSLKSIFQ